MPRMTRNGRVHITSTPQRASEGRRAAGVVPLPERFPAVQDATTGTLVLAAALVMRDAARTAPDDERRRAAKTVREARYKLRKHVGPEVAASTEAQLTADYGRALGLALVGSDELRHDVVASVASHALAAAEHDVRTVTGRIGFALAAIWHALFMSAARKVARTGLGADPALTTVLRYTSTEHRLTFDTAARREREARDGARSEPTVIDIAGAVAAAERRARAAEPAGLDDEDEEPDDDDEGVETPDTPREGGKTEPSSSGSANAHDPPTPDLERRR